MSSLTTLPKGDSAWLLRKSIQRVMQQVSVLETNIGSSTTGNSSNTQVIFNDNGTLRGDSDLTFNTALNRLIATNLESTAALTVGTTATITGNLTVDTNTFFVDSTNNRVGIGTASPSTALNVVAGSSGINATFDTPSAGDTRIELKNNGTRAGYVYWDTSEVRQFADSGRALTFYPNATLGMTLNSTGLGVGVSPAAKLHMSDNTGSPAFRLNGAATANNGPFIEFYKNNVRTMLMGNESLLVGGGSTSNNFGFYNDGAFDFRWYINGTVPKMTLDASGNLLVGKTSASITTDGFQTLPSGEASVAMSATTGAATTLNVYSTGAAAYRFFVGMNGTISATNTTISAISDARFKENVQDIDVGLGAILALKPRKFDWKAGKGKDIKGDRGFIAQEFEQVFPQLVDEWKDPAPEGEAPYKSVRQDLIPVLVKAIQELTARVQTLEAR